MAAHFNVIFLTLPLKCICSNIAIALQSHPLLQFKYFLNLPLALFIAAKCYKALNTQLTLFSVQIPTRELYFLVKRGLFMSSYLFICPCDPGISYTWNVQGLFHKLIAINQSIFTQVLHWMAELGHIIFLWSHRLLSFKAFKLSGICLLCRATIKLNLESLTLWFFDHHPPLFTKIFLD